MAELVLSVSHEVGDQWIVDWLPAGSRSFNLSKMSRPALGPTHSYQPNG